MLTGTTLKRVPVYKKFPSDPKKKILERKTLQATSGQVIVPLIEKQRYIDRIYMKGYCDKRGNPKEMPCMIHLEPHASIDRFNSVLRGIVNDKGGIVTISQ
jgi:hypothetical protein